MSTSSPPAAPSRPPSISSPLFSLALNGKMDGKGANVGFPCINGLLLAPALLRPELEHAEHPWSCAPETRRAKAAKREESTLAKQVTLCGSDWILISASRAQRPMASSFPPTLPRHVLSHANPNSIKLQTSSSISIDLSPRGKVPRVPYAPPSQLSNIPNNHSQTDDRSPL